MIQLRSCYTHLRRIVHPTNFSCDELSGDELSTRRIVRATNSPRRIVRDELSGDELS